MKIAETVTFGGSGFNRAAEMRSDAQVLWMQEDAQTILFWRGKPLIKNAQLERVSVSHSVPGLSEARVFLGLTSDGRPLFATDISDWAPENLHEENLNSFLDPTEQEHPALPGAAFVELRGQMTRLTPEDAELAATARALFAWHQAHGFCAKCGTQSAISQGGWQRDCPACGVHHFPRTDPVVIMLITHGNSVLLGRSAQWPEGMYSLLAGFVEPGETMEAAVRREVFEESGVRVGEVGYLASQPWPFPASLMFGCHGVATTTEITLDPKELEDAVWVTRESLADIFAGQHPKILPARRGAIAHFLLENWLADRLD